MAQPLHIEEGLTEIYIRTNAECRGCNVNIRVRLSDGSILRTAFAAR